MQGNPTGTGLIAEAANRVPLAGFGIAAERAVIAVVINVADRKALADKAGLLSHLPACLADLDPVVREHSHKPAEVVVFLHLAATRHSGLKGFVQDWNSVPAWQRPEPKVPRGGFLRSVTVLWAVHTGGDVNELRRRIPLCHSVRDRLHMDIVDDLVAGETGHEL
jgi:hypothetical protein